MTLVIRAVFILAALLISNARVQAAEIVEDAVATEKAEISKRCASPVYGADFVDNVDFNNDGLVDVITNQGAVDCDDVAGALCGDVGCPHNFYIAVSEGGYFLAASADLYGYDMTKRYGNMVMHLKANAASCERDDSEYCIITIRVRGARFETISKK